MQSRAFISIAAVISSITNVLSAPVSRDSAAATVYLWNPVATEYLRMHEPLLPSPLASSVYPTYNSDSPLHRNDNLDGVGRPCYTPVPTPSPLMDYSYESYDIG